MGSSFVQIGQFLTWGDKCSSAISHNSTGHQDFACNP
jgi:hypothetical protein